MDRDTGCKIDREESVAKTSVPWKMNCTNVWSARTKECAEVTDAILRSKAGIKDPTKPIGSFLFPRTYRCR